MTTKQKRKQLYTQTVKTATAALAPVQLTAEAAQRFNADGETISLVALPVLPGSPFRTQDSRSGIEFSYEAAQLIATHAARKRKLPLDVEHATEIGGGFTQPDTRARGWVHALCTAETEPALGLEPGVLYALVELTPLGAQEISDKLYGFTSAVALGFWLEEGKHSFLRIKSLALTNNPACDMPALFTAADGAEADDESDATILAGQGETGAKDGCYTSEQSPADTDEQEMKELLEQLRAALGLAEDADAATALAGVGTLTAAFTATRQAADEATAQVQTLTATVQTLTQERNDAVAQLKAAQDAEAERTVLAAVDAAIVARKATPAQRDSLVELARANLAAFTAAMQSAPEILSADGVQPPAVDNTFGLDADELARCKQLRIDPAIYARNKQAA